MGLKTWWNKPVASCESIRWPAEAAPAESPNRVTLITTIVIILIWSLWSFLNVSIAYRLHNQYHKMLRNEDIQDAKENSLANSPNSVIAITVLIRSVVIITIIWIKITWKGLLQNRQYSSAPTPGQRPCPEETENENCIFTFHHHHWKNSEKFGFSPDFQRPPLCRGKGSQADRVFKILSCVNIFREPSIEIRWSRWHLSSVDLLSMEWIFRKGVCNLTKTCSWLQQQQHPQKQQASPHPSYKQR